MSHLNLETLARLVDDAPDPTEAGHLDICAQCRDELEMLRADASALRALPDPQPPIAAWVALEQRLAREGLLHSTHWTTHALRMAAVLAIFALGSVTGGLLMRNQRVAPATAAAFEPAPLQVATPRPAGPAMRTDSPRPAASLAAAAPAPAVTTRPAATVEEAVTQLRDAEQAYLAALGRYSDFSSRAETTDPVARLAALESIIATTRAALGQSPADPVINGYHLTAVAQRDATLRQLAASGQTWY
jgi:hypothetical protein